MSTNTDRRVLRAISTHWNLHGHAPSLRAIRDMVGVKSHGTVNHHIGQLLQRGLVASERNTGGTLRLTPAGIEALEGTFPMVPFNDPSLVEGHQVICYLKPRAVVES